LVEAPGLINEVGMVEGDIQITRYELAGGA
jgi:hypothetical protein